MWAAGLAALALAGAAQAFALDDVDRIARDLAAEPYRPPSAVAPAAAASAAYDSYRSIRFRRDRALWRDEALPFEAQFFPAGGAFTHPVQIQEIVDGEVRPLRVTRSDFTPAQAVLADPAAGRDAAALAGFRITHPLNRPTHHDELIAFLGASYFRALGQRQQYGLSARGLAIDTTGGLREEFPSFTRFWLERPAPGAQSMTFYALLEGPRVAGAYRFDLRPGATTVVDVQARLHLRGPVGVLGIAPLTSMFFSGENQPVAGDFRPEVHDSDGLQLATAEGEWIWRPLVRPAAPFATSFAMRGVRGFGLMQRDRRFTSYEDLEARYHRRPSAWVEPLGDWGAGRVELLQLPAASEADDNIVAFWVPAQTPSRGQPLSFAWRIHWAGDQPPRPPVASVQQTRAGAGFRRAGQPAGRLQFHVDFVGPALTALPPDAEVEAVASASSNVRGLLARVEPNPELPGWRATLEFERLDPARPVELRAFLRHGKDTLSETWSYALPPE